MKLDSGVFPVGTKITVSPMIKNNAYPPFSVGFVGSFSGQFSHSPNVAILNVSIIRKGRRGKQRVETTHLTTQIFDIEMERKKIESNEFKGYLFIHMANTGDIYSNIMDMEPLEFLGWGAAYHTYIADIYKEADATRKWPNSKYSPINVMGNMCHRFYNDPEGTLQSYAGEEFRINFVRTLRRMEASVAKTAMQYKFRTCSAELKAAAYLLWDNLKEKSELYDEKVVIDNYNFYRKQYHTFCSVASDVDMARYRLSTEAENKARQISKPIPLPAARSANNLLRSLRKLAKAGAKPHFQNVVFNEGRV